MRMSDVLVSENSSEPRTHNSWHRASVGCYFMFIIKTEFPIYPPSLCFLPFTSFTWIWNDWKQSELGKLFLNWSLGKSLILADRTNGYTPVGFIGCCSGNHLDALNDWADAEAQSTACAPVVHRGKVRLWIECNGLKDRGHYRNEAPK